MEGAPVGSIDWDTAGPIDPVWELAQTAWLNVQLHDDDIAERLGLGDAHARAHQLKLIVDAYGLAAMDRDGFLDKMVEFAVHSARNDAIEHNVTPETETGTADDGYRLSGASPGEYAAPHGCSTTADSSKTLSACRHKGLTTQPR